MKTWATPLLGAALAVSGMSFAENPTGLRPADSPRAAIEAANAAISAALARGDSAALAHMFDVHGTLMPPGNEPVRGIEAIQKAVQGMVDSGIAGIDLKTLEVYAQGRTATEVGEYQLKDKSGKVLDHGKYIVIWRHVGSEWKLLRDMSSSNVTPPKS